jgi:hypothetical protein
MMNNVLKLYACHYKYKFQKPGVRTISNVLVTYKHKNASSLSN